jgi:hypothetical protein
MEPVKEKVRYKLLLDKCQVIEATYGELGLTFKAISPRGMTIKADLSFQADLRVGDILSIYTEIYAHANPGPTSVQ